MARYSEKLKNTRMWVVANQLTGGAIVLFDGEKEIARCEIGESGGDVDGSVLTLPGPMTCLNASASGQATRAELQDEAGEGVVLDVSVGEKGEIKLDDRQITEGQTVTISGFTIRHG